MQRGLVGAEARAKLPPLLTTACPRGSTARRAAWRGSTGTAKAWQPTVDGFVGHEPSGPQSARPAGRDCALRDLVEEHLRKYPDAAFTPHQVGKVLTRSAGAVANALDKLVSLGTAQMVTDKPRTYQLATAAPAPRTRLATPPPARRPRPAPRNTRPAPPPRLRVVPARPACGRGRALTPSRRAGRRPLPARYIRALTGAVPRQVHAPARARYMKGHRK